MLRHRVGDVDGTEERRLRVVGERHLNGHVGKLGMRKRERRHVHVANGHRDHGGVFRKVEARLLRIVRWRYTEVIVTVKK